LEALVALDAEADEGADLAAELSRLLLGQVAQMLDLDLAVRVLVDRERVDHAHRVALTQPFELGDDLAVELGMVKAQHDELDRSNRHDVSLQIGASDTRATQRSQPIVSPRCVAGITSMG